MRTIEEVQKELAEVNAAISAIVTGAQSYTVGSRSLTRASLAELRRLKDDLLAELEARKSPPSLRRWSARRSLTGRRS